MKAMADRFTQALHRLERERDVEALLKLFTNDISLWRAPRSSVYEGGEGARKFWAEYLDTFATIETKFRKVIAAGDTVVLEWSSAANTSSGSSIEYDGCTILEGSDQGISRFRTYYDASSAGLGGAAAAPGKLPDPATEVVMEPTQEAG